MKMDDLQNLQFSD